MFSTLSLDGSNRIIASELVLINSTEPSTLSSVYATKQELADTAGSLGGGYTIEEVDALILAQKNKIDANISAISGINATSTTMFDEQINQNATITSNFNNITAHGLTITSILPTISANTTKLDTNANNISSNTFLISGFNNSISSNSFLITGHNNTLASHLAVLTTHDSDIATNTNGIAILNNTVGSNMTFVNSHQNTITSHISLIDTNLNNITGHGNTISTILTDIADLQAGAGASWTTTEKTTIQADVSTLYTNDTNLFNTNTAYSNTFASIISDNTTQDVLITQNSNTINSLISADLQKLDKIDTNAQSVAGAINFSDNATLHSDLNMLTTGSIICNKFSCTPSPNLGLQMTFQMFNREFNINRDGRMWMSSSGGVWETQIGDANVGRVWIKDRFGLGAVGVVNYVLNCAGQARFTSAVQFIGTDSAISLNNGSYLNFNNNGSIRRYTPDATEGLYMAHNNFVAVSVGDITNSSNQYFMCDGAVSKTIFNKPVDVLGDVYTNGDLTMVSGKKVEVNQVQSVSGNTLLLQNSPSGNVQFGNTSKLIIDNAEMYVDTNDLIIRNSNTSNSINLVVGLSSTYADNKIILNSGSNSELRGDWTIDGDMTFGIAHKINLRHLNSDAVLRLEASTTIDSYIDGTKYLQLDDTQFSSFNGFNLSSDKRLKDNIEDVEDDTINMVKNIKIKTFVKNQKTKRTELGWIAQDVQQYTNPKYNIVNDSGEYLTMCYDRMACISWDALSKLIHRVEYLENEVFKNKNKKEKSK